MGCYSVPNCEVGMRPGCIALITLALAAVAGAQPGIRSSGIVNASGYQTQLAPDTVFVIFGSGLGPSAIQVAQAPNYSATLAGTSVNFSPTAGGATIPAKMIYTLATQIAGLLPSSITPGTYAVTVTYSGQTSAPQNVTVVARSFGIATANSAGTGNAQATIGNVNGGLSLTRFTSGSVAFSGYNWTLTPAHPGDTLVLWGTGGGADPANDTGGSSGDQTAAGNFVVLANGVSIKPLYAGTSQGYPGLWQINFTLPADFTPDCFVYVQVNAGGPLSNGVTIPTAPAGQDTCSTPGFTPAALSKLDAGGNVTFAGMTIGKINVGGAGFPAASGDQVIDIVGGPFNQYTAANWLLPYSAPKVAGCTVWTLSYPSSGPVPGNPSALLDAGSKLTLTGPNATGGTAVPSIAGPSGPVYSATLASGAIAPGGTYTLSGTGGTQVGAFTSTVTMPASFSITNASAWPR